MSGQRFLVLGGGDGWHANQLRMAAADAGCELSIATYESLGGHLHACGQAKIGGPATIHSDAGPLSGFDAVLTRTMPAASLEQITFRLATLHALVSPPLVNPPRSLEIAIDKFATLAHVAKLGFPVPETIVVQSRGEAMDAFKQLGGDCVVKPLFGGEGRGVMRITDPELAWYTFSTLEGLDAICYLQRFVCPGGIDRRYLVIGNHVLGLRRSNDADFRTNVASGGRAKAIDVSASEQSMAQTICRSIGLRFAAVDILPDERGNERVLEVNAIPGWKGAQQVFQESIAARIIRLLQEEGTHVSTD